MTTNTQKLSFTFFPHDYLHVKNQHDPSITSADTTHKTILQYDLLGMKKKQKTKQGTFKIPYIGLRSLDLLCLYQNCCVH